MSRGLIILIIAGLIGAIIAYEASNRVPNEIKRPESAPLSAPEPTALQVGPSGAPPDPNTVPVPPAGSCHSVNGLPDHQCTPGLLNPGIAVSAPKIIVNVGSNSYDFCSRQFSTKLIRPPDSYTGPLKKRLMASYGIEVKNVAINATTYSTLEFYELDHDVSLEDMGHPWAVGNLWPQPRRMSYPTPGHPPVATGLTGPFAEDKDPLETAVHREECADPTKAQALSAQLAYDWTAMRGSTAVLPSDPTAEPEP